MQVAQTPVDTPDGWTLKLTRYGSQHALPPRRSEPGSPPVLVLPGYGMNAFIFRFHPSGPSFMATLLAHGLDPWSVDLRGTSTSRRRRGAGGVGLETQAFVDLPAALQRIREVTGHERVSAIGCSLGGVLLYAYAAMVSDPRMDRLVGMATPLVWGRRTPLLKAFSGLGPVLGTLPVRGTRRLARYALPVVTRVAPSMLSIYLNGRITDVSRAGELTRTVEDPHPRLNRQLARWIRAGSLTLRGRRVDEALRDFERPLLVVTGSGDGICPEDAALSVLSYVGGPAEHLPVSHPSGEPVGHADLFISEHAPQAVFTPVARWLSGLPTDQSSGA